MNFIFRDWINYQESRITNTTIRRLFSAVLDFWLLIVFNFPLLLLLPFLSARSAFLLLSGINVLVIPTYNILMVHKFGGTLGKILLGEGILDSIEGKRPTLGRAFHRESIGVVSYLVVMLYLVTGVKDQSKEAFISLLNQPNYLPYFHLVPLTFLVLASIEFASSLFLGGRTSLMDSIAHTTTLVYGKMKMSSPVGLLLFGALIVLEYLHVFQAFKEALLQSIRITGRF